VPVSLDAIAAALTAPLCFRKLRRFIQLGLGGAANGAHAAFAKLPGGLVAGDRGLWAYEGRGMASYHLARNRYCWSAAGDGEADLPPGVRANFLNQLII
jgi:hypothetical protein